MKTISLKSFKILLLSSGFVVVAFVSTATKASAETYDVWDKGNSPDAGAARMESATIIDTDSDSSSSDLKSLIEALPSSDTTDDSDPYWGNKHFSVGDGGGGNDPNGGGSYTGFNWDKSGGSKSDINGGGTPVTVPEPSTYALLAGSLGMLLFMTRRRQQPARI